MHRAIEVYQRSLKIFERLGDALGLAQTWGNLGSVYLRRGKWDGAVESYRQSLEAFTAIGLTREINKIHPVLADAAYHLGRQYIHQGRWYDGLQLLEESLTIRRKGDDLNALADVIRQIGVTRHLMGDIEQARIRYRDALRLYERTGNRHGIAACKAGLGRLAIQTGMLDRATHELEQAEKLYTELGETQRINELKDVLGLAAHIQERQAA